MTHSGDVAEQIMRMSLEGVDVAVRITGSAAKETALLLLAALKSPEKSGDGLKLKGKARLSSMLKSGKALEIFTIQERDLKQFYRGAKQYGIVYCAVRNAKNTPDGLCDILVKAEDAPKIARMAERFKFTTVEKGGVHSQIERETPPAAEKEARETRPTAPRKDSPSATISPTEARPEDRTASRPSVKAELREIAAARGFPTDAGKIMPNPQTIHRQSQGGKPKSRGDKGRA